MAVIQAATGMFALFASYRVVIAWHGTEALGLWSLISAFTLSIRLLDPSGGATIGRFVAIAKDRQNRDDAQKVAPNAALEYIDTALIMIGSLYILLCLLGRYPLEALLKWQLEDAEAYHHALEILPGMLALVPLMILATSSADALDGLNRADLRAQIMIGGFAVMLVSTLLLVPAMGLKGLLISQYGQHGFVIVASRFVLARCLPGTSWLPRHFRRKNAREMIGYGAKLQLAGLANFLADPIVRILVNHYGSLSALGLYELASKLVFQLRSLIVSAAMPLIPVLAVSRSFDDVDFRVLFCRANIKISLASAGLTIVAMVASKIIELMILTETSELLFNYVFFISLGFTINTAATMPYLHAQAKGNLKWNIIGQFSIGISTLIFTPILHNLFSELSVPLAFMFGLWLSAAIFTVSFMRTNNVTFLEMWRPTRRRPGNHI